MSFRFQGDGRTYAVIPGDIDHVRMECEVGDVDLALWLLQKWVTEDARPSAYVNLPPERLTIERDGLVVSISAVSDRYLVHTAANLQTVGRSPQEHLFPVIVALARAMKCRGGEVPPELVGPVGAPRWNLFGGVLR